MSSERALTVTRPVESSAMQLQEAFMELAMATRFVAMIADWSNYGDMASPSIQVSCFSQAHARKAESREDDCRPARLISAGRRTSGQHIWPGLILRHKPFGLPQKKTNSALIELSTSSYPARTSRNIEKSDGTVIFSPMALWQVRAGSHGEHEGRFLGSKRGYLN
jgi:hypothetical protein